MELLPVDVVGVTAASDTYLGLQKWLNERYQLDIAVAREKWVGARVKMERFGGTQFNYSTTGTGVSLRLVLDGHEDLIRVVVREDLYRNTLLFREAELTSCVVSEGEIRRERKKQARLKEDLLLKHGNRLAAFQAGKPSFKGILCGVSDLDFRVDKTKPADPMGSTVTLQPPPDSPSLVSKFVRLTGTGLLAGHYLQLGDVTAHDQKLKIISVRLRLSGVVVHGLRVDQVKVLS